MAAIDIAKKNLEKRAGAKMAVANAAGKGIGRRALEYMGFGAAVMAGGAGAAAGYDKLHRSLTEGSRYKAMLKSNPDLRDKPKGEVREVFDIVHEYSPDLTKHPAVAGSFVRKALEYKDVGISPASVKELVDIQTTRAKAHGYPTYSGMLRGMASRAPLEG